MTQIAIVQAAPPKAPQNNPSNVEESNSFSNHLDNALSKPPEKNNQAEHDRAKTSDSEPTTPPQNNTPDENVDNIVEKRETVSDIKETISNTLPTHLIAPLFNAASAASTNETLKTGAAESPLPSLKSSLLPLVAENPDTLQKIGQGDVNVPKSFSATLQTNATQPAGSTQEDLLAKLQQIIDNSSETGIVTIKRVDSPQVKGVLSQFSGSEQIIATTSDSADLDFFKTSNAELFGLNIRPEQTGKQTTSIRQNVQNQYYDAKMSMQNIGDKKDGTRDNSQDMGNSPQSSSSSLQNNQLTPANTSGNEFTILTGTVQDSSTAPVIDPARTTVLPSGLVVHEDEVIQQLVERFQVSRRHLDNRVNIKLHPAELGELNINLSVKEGSIRAHVVAQSHHVQEIIEKNIAKLKSVLEDQGFTVAEISIHSESESVGDFDLFDQQLFNNNDYEPQVKKDNSRMGIPFSIDDIEMEIAPESTGVNVTA